jgi:hypothetical protein
MASIIAFVSAITTLNVPAGQYSIRGEAQVDGAGLADAIAWEVFVNFSDSVPVVNGACMAAAVAAAQALGLTVEPADKRTLFASAILGN